MADYLVALYWLCFGVGLVYVLLAGALGAISHGFAGAHGGDHGGFDHSGDQGVDGGFDHDFDSDHGGELQSLDLDHDATDGHGGGGAAGLATYDSGMPGYNPFSLLSLMGTLCGFGAGGLLATQLNWPLFAGLGLAFGGALLMGALLWLVIGKLLYSLHASSEAHVADMVGLEAEVITPVEHTMSGEIAYILDGTRYTAPARLLTEGRVAKNEKVRIRRVGPNLVYVEEKRSLLS